MISFCLSFTPHIFFSVYLPLNSWTLFPESFVGYLLLLLLPFLLLGCCCCCCLAVFRVCTFCCHRSVVFSLSFRVYRHGDWKMWKQWQITIRFQRWLFSILLPQFSFESSSILHDESMRMQMCVRMNWFKLVQLLNRTITLNHSEFPSGDKQFAGGGKVCRFTSCKVIARYCFLWRWQKKINSFRFQTN